MDERIAHTVTFLLRCPGSTVPEAMRACKFSLEESLHPAKQMAVRRSFAKASAGKAVAPPDVIVAAATATTTTVSPLTNQTSAVRGPSTPPTTTTTTTTTADLRTTIPKGVIVARRGRPSDGRGIAGVTTTTTMGGPGNDDVEAVGRFARAGRR